MTELQSDKDERSDIERAAWECIEIAAKQVGKSHAERVAWNHGAMACHDAIKRLAIVRPECGTLTGETPRTENGEWPTPKHAQEIVFEGRGCVVMSPEEYEALYNHAAQLERELYVSQNDLGRLEESNRQAQKTIDDLRQQLAEAMIQQQRDAGAINELTGRLAVSTSGLIPQWIVNDIGELGVKVGDRFFFLYKGDNIIYGEDADDSKDGIATHDSGEPMMYRIVGKREFGETCQPIEHFRKKWPGGQGAPYREPVIFTPGLSSGSPTDGDWKPLPALSASGTSSK